MKSFRDYLKDPKNSFVFYTKINGQQLFYHDDLGNILRNGYRDAKLFGTNNLKEYKRDYDLFKFAFEQLSKKELKDSDIFYENFK